MNIEFLTLKQVAEILKVTPVHVQNLIHGGKLKGYKFGSGRGMRVQMADLIDFIGGSQVIDKELMRKGGDFHLKILESMVEGKMTREAAINLHKGGDPEGCQAHEYFQQHKFDKPSVSAAGNPRFDNPVSGSGAAGGGSVAGGLNFEQAVTQIMAQEHCRECEAVRLLMQSPEGQALFEKHWSEIEQGAKERSNVYFK